MTVDGSIDGANGLAGADAKCAALATAASLPAGTYKAWLSTSAVDASARLGSARGFTRPDGEPFADRVSDITAGKILHSLNLDEAGNDVNLAGAGTQNVWTGTTNLGTVAGSSTCVDWTSTSNTDFGEIGRTFGGPGLWSDISGSFSCNDGSQMRLYCFDTTHITPLAVTPVPGRIAFVSAGSFDTTSGVTGADTLCQTEAAAASLTGPTNFLALLSTSAASAASRFDLSALSLPYVRPDGIKIADAPTIASGAALDSGIWQHADGSYAVVGTWTGSSTPSTVGTTHTCANWTSKSGSVNGALGDASVADPSWWSPTLTTACSNSLSVYCLDQ